MPLYYNDSSKSATAAKKGGQNNMENKLRTIRKERGYTQESLARAAGVHRTSIARYETGKRGLGAKNLMRLADTLKVPVDDLMERTESA